MQGLGAQEGWRVAPARDRCGEGSSQLSVAARALQGGLHQEGDKGRAAPAGGSGWWRN